MMLSTIVTKLKREWFLIGIITAILMAKFAPFIGKSGGPLKPEYTVKYLAVCIIFFNSGISLRSEELLQSFTNYRLHLLVQGFTFIFVPIFVNLLVLVLIQAPIIDNWLLKGLIVVSCMPPPVSSAVILTKASGGNEAGAIFNSAFGSFLGIIVTPLLLFWTLGSSTSVPFLSIFIKLGLTVLLPLIIGQCARLYIKDWLERTKPPLGTIGSCVLLTIIYTTFCDAFSGKEIHYISMNNFLVIIVIIFFCQVQFMAILYYLSTRFGFHPNDVVAAVFCGTHKSLTLGIPVLKIVFGEYKQLPVLSIPLLVYHPLQILFGGLMVPVAQRWLQNRKTEMTELV